MIKIYNQLLILIFFLSFVSSKDGIDIYKSIQSDLILKSQNKTIFLPEGHFNISRSLWAENLNNVIIQGQGVDKTILNFEFQVEGSEGLKIINSKNILLKDFTIQNSIGDLIKIEDSQNIKLLNIKAEWTDGPKESNGSYAIYPVKTENIIIDKCIAIGASDAGIYVGQSKNIIVKNSEAYNNVAGIEIENSTNADVFNNYTHDNAGGILVFDLPDLLVKKGEKIRVFNNLVLENNLFNFAPVGNIVAKVPSGSGIMILATSKVEIFNNVIFENRTANISIVSYFITDEPISDSLYYPYPNSIFIYDNIFKRSRQFPALSFKQPIGFLLAYHYWRDIPNIIYDGIIDSTLLEENGLVKDKYRICIKDNINSSITNLDAGNDFLNINSDKDYFECELEKIEPVILSIQND